MALKVPQGGCTVRMYRQGLGDCFLLGFAGKNRKKRYVLIDCGVLLGTENSDYFMKRVAEDIRETTQGHLDALVVTHEHWDHVSGFTQAQSVFKQITVDELWLAWTEDPDDPLAKELRARKLQALRALQMATMRLGASESSHAEKILNLNSFFGGDLGASGRPTTEKTLDWIKTKVPKPRYCKPGMDPLKLHGLPEVSFYVLAPPADKKMLRKSSPSERAGEVYLDDLFMEGLAPFLSGLGVSPAVAMSRDGAEQTGFMPFNQAYGIKPDSEDADAIKKLYESEPWRKIDDNWLEMAGELALKLDSHTNNTSLVLAIELNPGGKVLLFPGDAQVGNWMSWHNVEWNSEGRRITAEDLLRRTVLYKVGHHGSHNATLRDKGLELMTDPGLTALIPVDQKMAAKKRWRMPHKPLYERLLELTAGRVVLADTLMAEMTGGNSLANEGKRGPHNDLYIDVVVSG